jgi:hypothetical protein
MPSNTAVPNDLNFVVVRGDAAFFTLTVTFAPSAPSADLNTYAIWMTAKNSYTNLDEDAVFQLTKADGDITVDGSNHAIAHVKLPGSATAGLPCLPPLNRAILVYDLQIKGADGLVYTVARGQITVVADATLNTS